jgi:hypothetical protein
MALGKGGKLLGSYIFDAPFVHNAIGYVALFNEFPQPLGGEWIDFVIIGGHLSLL